jgi:DNA-binding MurR/RpiR family transcriptional regulator
MARQIGSTPPSTVAELKNLIARRQIILPESLEKVARYALEHPEVFAFDSAKSIARRCAVSPTTVSRLPALLGMETFDELRKLFRLHLRELRAFR